MSRSSPAFQSNGFTPLRATIVPIGSEGLSVFESERDAEPPAVRPDRPVRAEPARAPAAPNKRPLLFWLGIVTPAMAAGAMIGLALTTLGATPAAPAMGAVTITSEPSGAPVTIDGIARGSTPLAMVVAAGSHRLEVGTGAEVPPRLLQVTPGGDTSMHVQWRVTPAAAPPATAPNASGQADQARPHAAPVIAERSPRVERAKAAVGITATFRPVPTGWLAVTSAFPVQILEDGSEIGTSANTRLALPAGEHSLTLVNDPLEFREARLVTIAAGKKAAIALDTPRGTLNVNARPWAEVWVDGRRVGETPIGNLALPIGDHEVTFRHPKHGEQRKTVTVGARSVARVAVEFQP